MQNNKHFFTLLLSLWVTIATAQVDSLRNALKTATDTTRINVLNSLGIQLCENEPQKAVEYSREAIRLSEQHKFPIGKAKALNTIGIVHDITGKYDSALYYYGRSIIISRAEKNKKQVANTLNNIGLVQWNKGEYDEALNNYISALKLFEEIGNKKGQANTLSNIGLIYTDLKKFREALSYHQRALKIREELKDDYGIGVSLTNLGRSYSDLNDPKAALDHSLRAIEKKKESGDLYGLAISLNNTGIVYHEMGNIDKALEYHLMALPIREKVEDKFGLVTSYNNISGIYNQKKDYRKALEYSLLSLALAKEIGSPAKLKKVYHDLSIAYKSLGDHQKALEYHEQYAELNDSIFSEESAKQIAEMQTRYETEKKDLELAKQSLELSKSQLEAARQRTQRNVLLVSILIILVIGYLVYSRYKLRQKEEAQRELNRQQQLRSAAILEAEEKERVRIAQELHDGIGQQLSAVKLNMSSFQSSFKNADETQQQLLQNALAIIDDSVKEVRAVSHSMMPNALIKSGLAAAVREFVNRISHTGRLRIELEIDGLNERLDSAMETILFRVLQETVNNIIRHSQATVVNIQLFRHEEEVSLVVEDNGVGFDPRQVLSGGIGLKNIRSRVEYLEGTVDFDSHPGKGTTVSISIPLKK